LLCATTQLIKHPEPALECELTLVKVMTHCFPTESSPCLQHDQDWKAYCLRFTHSTRNSSSRKTSCLASTELRDALHTCLKVAQQEIHTQEVDDRKKGSTSKSQFQHLHPFLDKEDYL